jgi:hypothetical protein
MKKTLFILFALSTFTKLAIAQDFPYDAVTNGEVEMKKYDKDTSAHAVVLREFGKTSIGLVTGENIKLTFEYHVKIKIIDNKGLDNGTVVLEAYNYNQDAELYDQINVF